MQSTIFSTLVSWVCIFQNAKMCAYMMHNSIHMHTYADTCLFYASSVEICFDQMFSNSHEQILSACLTILPLLQGWTIQRCSILQQCEMVKHADITLHVYIHAYIYTYNQAAALNKSGSVFMSTGTDTHTCKYTYMRIYIHAYISTYIHTIRRPLSTNPDLSSCPQEAIRTLLLSVLRYATLCMEVHI